MAALGWMARRSRIVASVATLVVIAGVPVTIAVLHKGYPVSSVDLVQRDVWVTNSQQALGGRLNRQINELTSAVSASSGKLDVFQDGNQIFLQDKGKNKLERVDPAFVQFEDSVSLPADSSVSFHDGVIAIVDKAGALWTVDANSKLQFNAKKDKPLLQLGEGGTAVVADDGSVDAVAPAAGKLYRIPAGGGKPATSKVPTLTDYELTAVGSDPVILDRARNQVVLPNGNISKLTGDAMRIQQAGPQSDGVLVSAANGLLSVALSSGNVTEVGPRLKTAANSPDSVAAPVRLAGCDHSAWASARSYVLACDGSAAKSFELSQASTSSELKFRVNGTTIALNDLQTGNVWVASQSLKLINNWSDVTPPSDADAPQGDQKSATQSFEDTIAQRTPENRPPTARPDTFGVRPGSSTELPVLANDADPDGDVLVITDVTDGWEGSGRLDLIDGGRSLQFTPNPDANGSFTFTYSVSDGREGGTASANVSVTIVPLDVNHPPVAMRSGATSVEAGQSVSYNVLTDWIDPDGDDIYLASASGRGGDTVQYSPNGTVTFRNTTDRPGQTAIDFTVSDGRLSATGTLDVEVKADGSLKPVGTPDFFSGFTSQTISLSPLDNDASPSGAPLKLLAVKAITAGTKTSVNADLGTIVFSASTAGSYYLEYTLGAGAETAIGLIRVNVTEDPSKPQAPIAVKDTVYLRGAEEGVLDPLLNDVSPSGRVLAIQSMSIPPADVGLHVAMTANSELRVTAANAITKTTSFTYTISDGLNTSTASISVVPVPPLITHQAPVAVDDTATVRAGDVVRVGVTDNDSDPDGVAIHVAPQLVEQPTAGLAFVSGNEVRYQAPKVPGTYSAVYTLLDDYGQTATASVTFTVLAADAKGDRPPTPQPITARVFQGGHVTINVPLDGIDPDGDSTQLVDFPSLPALGSVAASTTAFTYTADTVNAGTDSFTYEVVDSYGQSGTGTVRIGVIQRPAQTLEPVAVNDATAIRPNRVGTVPVLANDSDPNGYSLQVSPKLTLPDGVKASVTGNQIEVHAGVKSGSFVIGYTVTNGHGGVANANVAVTVSPTAPLQNPTAIDHPVAQKSIINKKTFNVDVRAGSTNPGGRIQDLVVSLSGPNAGLATVLSNGEVRVTPGDSRTVIAYTLTDAPDKTSATAFIIVPPAAGPKSQQPPVINPKLPKQIINVNSSKTWKLSDIVYAPSGRPTMITAASTVSATHLLSGSAYLSPTELKYTPQKDYRGLASITFRVTDGASAADPKGNKATLTLTFQVGDPNYLDQAPTFTSPSISLPAGTQLDFDLHSAESHPNPSVIASTSFNDLSGATSQVGATQNGSSLHFSAPRNAKIGSTAHITFSGHYANFTFSGYVQITVVSSAEPLPVAVDDHDYAARAKTTTVNVIANDSNPFPDTPLRVVDAVIENPASAAMVSHTASSVTVTAGPQFVGDVVVIYTVQDATDDSTRQVTGRLTVTVWDQPSQPAPPTIVSTSAGSATIRFTAPVSTNGTDITGYTLRTSPAVSVPTCNAGTNCTFSNLANGTTYTFFVTANASVPGSSITTKSNESDPSAGATPRKAPAAPASASMSKSGYAPATVTMSWTSTSDSGGGAVRYYYQINGSGSSYSTSLSASVGGQPAGTYNGQVRACNQGNDGDYTNPANCSAWTQASPTVVSDAPPYPYTDSANKATCGVDGNHFNSYNNVCDQPISAGTQMIFQCRGQQNGVQWGLMASNAWGGAYYVKFADMNVRGGGQRTSGAAC
ncbi:MAG: Ig-like domain-containing protein [Pseudolysinimonas sp.]